MNRAGLRIAPALLILTCLVLSCQLKAQTASAWDPNAAAKYLDYRQSWWMQWTGSARDHGTVCVSCHTVLPYALSRPALDVAVGQQQPSDNERKLVENVTKRVRIWRETEPYYDDEGYGAGKTAESRGTESVLNATILAKYDALQGHLSEDTVAAFQNMWAQQETIGEDAGTWHWLQFDQEPWEANDSKFFGGALAAVAVGIAPGNYRARNDVQANLKRLHDYLSRQEKDQSLNNRVFLLWASTKLPGLLAPEDQQAIIREVLSKQQVDGGWRSATLAWRWRGWTWKSLVNMWAREDGTPLKGKSDGYATALVTLALEDAGVSTNNPALQRGRSWLLHNQDKNDGSWPGYSVNKQHHISKETAQFMKDAATAYAVMALTTSTNPKAVTTVAKH